MNDRIPTTIEGSTSCPSPGEAIGRPEPAGIIARLKGTRILWGLKILLLVIVIYYVARAMARQLREVPWQQIDFQPQYLVASLLLTCLAMFLSAVAYRILIAGFARPPSLTAMCAVTWLPSLGKYLPGKVASVAGAIWLLNRCGVPTDTAASAVMVQQSLGVLTGLLMAMPLCFWQSVREEFPLLWPCLLAGPVVGLAFLHPAVLRPAVNFALRCLGRAQLPSVPSFRQYLPNILANLAGWVVGGSAAWMAARSMTSLSPNSLLIFVGTTALANSVGILTFIPGGLGVREGIMLVVLTPLTGPVTSIVAVLMRVVITVAEIILSGVSVVIVRRMGRSASDRTVG